MFTLKDNTKIKGCVNVNEIMFEDGRAFEVTPSDGIYYSSCGVYERFNDFNKIAPNIYKLNGSIYAFRSHTPRSIIADDNVEIYNCANNYIMKFGKYFLFGDLVLL